MTVNATTGVWRFTPTAQARLDSYTTPGDQTVTFVINATDGDATTAVTVMAPIDPDPLDTYMWDTFPVGSSPQFAVSRGDRLYVAAGAEFYVIDTTPDKVIDINPPLSRWTHRVGGSYATIDSERLYVNSGRAVTVIDLNSNSSSAVPSTSARPPCAAYCQRQSALPSSKAGTVHVVDLTTIPSWARPSPSACGHGMAASGSTSSSEHGSTACPSSTPPPTPLSVHPSPLARFLGPRGHGNRLFVANIFGNSLSVIDTTTNALIDVTPQPRRSTRSASIPGPPEWPSEVIACTSLSRARTVLHRR